MQNAIVETNTIATTANVAVQSNVYEMASVVQVKSMYARLEQLNIEANAWEQGAYANANAQLYGLFKKSYEIYKELTDATDGNIGIKKQALKDYMNLKGLSKYWDKPLTQRIIRCVFGDRDRRRISTYHTVLRYIVAKNWSVDAVVQGITDAGGVQEISLGHPDSYVSPKNRAAAANAVVSEKVLAVVSSDKLADHFNPEKHGEKLAAVLTQNPDGTFSVNCIVSSNTAVNATLAAFYGQNKAALKEAAAVKANAEKAATAEDHLAAAKAA